MVNLGTLPTYPQGQSYAHAVSADGAVVVGRATTNENPDPEAFLWTQAGGMVGLGWLPQQNQSIAHGVSGDGSVIVGESRGSNYKAFIWDQTHGMRELRQVLIDLGLNLNGWQLIQANGVSADGLTIVGYGYDPAGRSEAWVARIPEPGTLALLALGAALLARRRAGG
jgi:probable HAF family extracellular repeat protein